MQFGRLHAIALFVFGVFLLLAQAWISLASNDATPAASSAVQSAPSQSSDRESIIHLLPGILGSLCVVGGFVFYLRERDRPTDVPVHPIR